MKAITIQQIRQAIGGKALSEIPASHPPITAVCTDTRRMQTHSVFFALRGDRFDAHAFLPQAAAGGALVAVVDTPPPTLLPNVTLIQVPDTLAAMGKLARYVRSQMRSKIIAVAGSNGKTSTKHLIDAALRCRLRGNASPSSFNNNIGVPLTIFPADPNQDYLILELGTNHPGEIAVLTEMAQPDIGVITNCSAEHLEGLGDLLGVRRENASLIAGMNANGLLVVNGDDPDLLEAVSNYDGRRVTFGFGTHNDLYASDVEIGREGTSFSLNGRRDRRAFVPQLGRHAACNALAAIAVGRRMGLTEADILPALRQAHVPDMRMQLLNVEGIDVLVDCYNANPASAFAALDTFARLECQGRRIVMLGDMLELGISSDRLHHELGQHAARTPIDVLGCSGPQGKLIAQAAADAGFPADRLLSFRDSADAAAAIGNLVAPGDLVLLKGSRGMRMERILHALRTEPEAPAAIRVAG